jgi:hypothetical protein
MLSCSWLSAALWSPTRDGATLVQEVLCEFRRPRAPPPPTARGQVAHGRCVTNTFPKLEMWSCMRDEGGPLGAGSQVQASNYCKLLSSKAMVVSVAARGGT